MSIRFADPAVALFDKARSLSFDGHSTSSQIGTFGLPLLLFRMRPIVAYASLICITLNSPLLNTACKDADPAQLDLARQQIDVFGSVILCSTGH